MPSATNRTAPKRRVSQSLNLGTPASTRAAVEVALRALPKITDIGEIKDIRDRAEAVRQYADNAGADLALQNRIAELAMHAERRAGTILRSMHLRGGDRKSRRYRSRPTLETLGINEGLSRRWQKLAAIPEAKFQAYIADARKKGSKFTRIALLRWVAFRSRRR